MFLLPTNPHLPELSLTPFAFFAIDVGAPIDLGRYDSMQRRCVPITGGTVTGSLSGRVVSGGADWQTVGSQVVEIGARYIIDADEGLVEVESTGLRSAPSAVIERINRGESVPKEQYYFRTSIRLRTAAPALADLNAKLFVSHGERTPTGVRLAVYTVD